MTTVAISGRLHSGKDAAAGRLMSQLGFARVGFADALKDFCAKLTGLPRELFDDQAMKDRVILEVLRSHPQEDARNELFTMRELMQRVGDSSRSLWGNRFWSELVLARCTGDGVPNHVIPDLRYPHEYAAVRAAPASFIVRVNRADRIGAHDFWWPAEGPPRCTYNWANGERSANGARCGLPESAHPTHLAQLNAHDSEWAMPDKSNAWVKYDAVFTSGSAEEGALAVIDWMHNHIDGGEEQIDAALGRDAAEMKSRGSRRLPVGGAEGGGVTPLPPAPVDARESSVSKEIAPVDEADSGLARAESASTLEK